MNFAVLKQWLLAERVVRKIIYKVQWPHWEMKNQWSCWLAGWERCLNSGALLKFISYRPTFRRPLHRCLNKTNSSNHQQPQLLLCHQGSILLQSLATWQFSGCLGQQGALLSFDFPSSPDFKHHPCTFRFTRGIFLGEPRKSEGDCQQFSSDWQVPLRQEEAFMVTGLHLGGDDCGTQTKNQIRRLSWIGLKYVGISIPKHCRWTRSSSPVEGIDVYPPTY